jgi:hypothetical protein
MHEVRADGAAIDPASFFGGWTGEMIELGLLEGAEETQRVEIGFEVPRAAESVEDELTVSVRGAIQGGFLGCSRQL